MVMDVMNLKETFQELKGRFEQDSREHPAMHHYWVQGVQFVNTPVLEWVARGHGWTLVEVTKWPREGGRVDYSCLAGSGELLERFKGLAREARSLFKELGRQLDGSLRHTVYEGHVAWLADLYFEAGDNPAPLLSANRFLVAEWPTAAGSVKLLTFPDDDQAQALIQQLRTTSGEPLAIHRGQALLAAGAVSASFAGGYLAGRAIDKQFCLSDKLGDFLYDLDPLGLAPTHRLINKDLIQKLARATRHR
jgi:hypothetical protein